MRTTIVFLIALALGACESPPDARTPPPTSDVIKWTASPEVTRDAPDGGALLDINLFAEVEGGWKLYSLTQGSGGPAPMTVKLAQGSPYELVGDVRGPAPTRAMDSNFNIETETYTGAPLFQVTVKIPKDSDRQKPIELKVRSQACSETLCLPPRTTTLSVSADAETL